MRAVLLMLCCVLQFASLSVARSYPLWQKWKDLPYPRTHANAAILNYYVFVVGGTGNPGNLMSRFSSGEGLPTPPENDTNVLDVLAIDLDRAAMEQFWTAVKLPQRIAGRSFALADGSEGLFLSYACSIIGEDAASNMFLQVYWPLKKNLSNPVRVIPQPSSQYRRKAATFARYVLVDQTEHEEFPFATEVVYFFLFGGIDDSGIFIPYVEVFNGTTWVTLTTPQSLMPVPWCACGANANFYRVFLFGCTRCATGEPVHELIGFSIKDMAWIRNLNDQVEQFAFPANRGSSGALMRIYSTSFYYPPAANAPQILLFDVTTNETTVQNTEALRQPRTGVAALCISSNLIIFGGITLSDRTQASQLTDVVTVLPRPLSNFAKWSRFFEVGEEILIYTGKTCQTPLTRLRIATSMLCLIRVPGTVDVPCGNPTSIDTSNIEIEPGHSGDFFLCWSDGVCGAPAAERISCAHAASDASDCLWASCCWDPKTLQCYSKRIPDDPQEMYWSLVDTYPVIVAANTSHPTSEPPKKNNEDAWALKRKIAFLAGILLVVVVVVLLFVVMRKFHCRKKRGEVANELIVGSGTHRYQILERIGHGGAGEVFIGKRLSDGERVALKRLPFSDRRQRARAFAEYDWMVRFSHRRVVPVYDLFCSNTSPAVFRDSSSNLGSPFPSTTSLNDASQLSNYGTIGEIGAAVDENGGEHSPLLGSPFEDNYICIVSAYYPDGDLAKFVAEAKTAIPEARVCSIGRQISELLVFIHGQYPPVVHRDLKPENVLLSGQNIAVTDFGSARLHTVDLLRSRLGTLPYAAPEALRGACTTAVDIWGFGSVLYAMCSRRIGVHARALFSEVDDEEFSCGIEEELVNVNGYSKELASLILSCLQKEPDARPTARAVAATLREMVIKLRMEGKLEAGMK